MTTAATWSERLVESVGPIVVKEIRQGLRAKVFAIFFGTLLAACLTMALVAVAQAADAVGSSYGQEFFAAYLTALGGVCFFVIPFVAFRSMLRELEDETWVLLTLTGLGARSITRGKWVSAMSQAMLFASACAPFVLFSYFLNGIDLLQIAVALALSWVWTALTTAVALAVATQARSKLGRTLAHFVVLAVLGAATVGGVAFAWVLAEEGSRFLQEDAARNACLGLFSLGAASTVLALESAAAGLCLPSEAASKGPRLALLTVVLLGLGFGWTVFALEGGSRSDAAAGQLLTCFYLALAGAFAVSERDGWPAQTAALGALTRPGAYRSFLLVLGLIALSTAGWGAAWAHDSSWSFHLSNKHFRAIAGVPCYPVLYWSLAVLFGRLSPLRRLGEPVATRVAFVGCVVLGVVGSVTASFVVDGRGNDKFMNALNPLVGPVNFMERSSSELEPALVLLAAVTLVCGFLALLVLHANDKVRTT